MRKIAIFIAVSVLLLLCATPALANGIPKLPHAFYGSVEINDDPAPGGTQISATVDIGDIISTQNPITTVGDSYGIGSLYLLVQGYDIPDGATITFYVTNKDGTAVGGTATFEAGGGPDRIDLSVTIAAPTPGPGGGPAPRDTTPPRISNVSLCPAGVTETTADICWTTHEKSDSQVEYWRSGHIKSHLDEEMVINHHIHLTDLTLGATYHYKTMSRDRAGNLGVSDEYTFTTWREAPTPAFTISDLSISPSEVSIGEEVTISVVVTNTGNATGSYKVTFKIDGVVAATKEVTLKAGASEEVIFSTAKDVAGSYSVEVSGLIGSFTVKPLPPPPPEPPAPPPPAPPVAPPPPGINWAILGPIIAVAVFLAIFLPLRQRRRRRAG